MGMPLTDGDIQDILEAIGRLSYGFLYLFFWMILLLFIRESNYADMIIQFNLNGYTISPNGRRRAQYCIWDSNDESCLRLRTLYPQNYHLLVPAGVYNRYTGLYEERMVIFLGNPHNNDNDDQDFVYDHFPHITSREPILGNIPVFLNIPAPQPLVYLHMIFVGYRIRNMTFNISNPLVVTIHGIVLQVS